MGGKSLAMVSSISNWWNSQLIQPNGGIPSELLTSHALKFYAQKATFWSISQSPKVDLHSNNEDNSKMTIY